MTHNTYTHIHTQRRDGTAERTHQPVHSGIQARIHAIMELIKTR